MSLRAEVVNCYPSPSQDKIRKALWNAQAYHKPVKFVSRKYWITTDYYYDGTITISSNCTDPVFINRLNWTRDHYALAKATQLIYEYMNKWNK